jgi:isopentenyldiphosphate isomerase
MNESSWNGASLSQEEMMETDTVIAINDKDEIIGSASKKESHIFGLDQPRGILHRAFSVFLFDDETGELLLQQRASSKITFPNVRSTMITFFCKFVVWFDC